MIIERFLRPSMQLGLFIDGGTNSIIHSTRPASHIPKSSRILYWLLEKGRESWSGMLFTVGSGQLTLIATLAVDGKSILSLLDSAMRYRHIYHLKCQDAILTAYPSNVLL